MRKSKVRYWTLFCPKYWALNATGADSAATAAAAAASRADVRTKRTIGAPSTPTGCGLADTVAGSSPGGAEGPRRGPARLLNVYGQGVLTQPIRAIPRIDPRADRSPEPS